MGDAPRGGGRPRQRRILRGEKQGGGVAIALAGLLGALACRPWSVVSICTASVGRAFQVDQAALAKPGG
eukprot:3380232-Pyramimonas_sp.AAC.1